MGFRTSCSASRNLSESALTPDLSVLTVERRPLLLRAPYRRCEVHKHQKGPILLLSASILIATPCNYEHAVQGSSQVEKYDSLTDQGQLTLYDRPVAPQVQEVYRHPLRREPESLTSTHLSFAG